MGKHRKHYIPEEKVAIIRPHLVEKVLVSDLCQEQKLQPRVFYRWLKEFFENGTAASRKESEGARKHDKERIAAPEAKLKTKNEHQSLKRECIRPGVPLSLEDARRLMAGYIDHYNRVRLSF